MAGDKGIRIEGVRPLVRALRAAGDDGLQAELKAEHAELAQLVADTARPDVPRRSGKLAGSLRTSATVRAGMVRIGKASVPYAGPVHFGWPTRPNPGRGWRGGPISPNTFLYDALDRRGPEVMDRYRAAVDRIAAAITPEA